MMQKYLFGNYPAKLIEMLITSMFQASIIINILLPVIYTYLLKDYVPISHIVIWFIANIIMFAFRMAIKNKLEYSLKLENTQLINKYLNIYYLILLSSPILCAIAIADGIIYGADYYNIVSMLIVILALISGSLFTLGSIFTAFLLFSVLNYITIIFALIFLGGEQNYFFASIAFLLMIITTIIGKKYFTTLYNSILAQITFEKMFYKSADGMVLIRKKRFINCNDSIIKMFEFKNKDEFLEVNLNDFMEKKQPDGEPSFKKMVRMLRIAYTEGINRFEYKHRTKTGRSFWVEIVLTKIYLHGEVIIHGVWRDISAQKELDVIKEESIKKIEELNRSLESKVESIIKDLRKKDKILFEQSKLASMGEMIGNIAHQWRQPLSVISTIATSTLLQNEAKSLSDTKLESNMDLISDNVQYLSKTIDDFRNFIQKDREKMVFNLKHTIDIFLELNSSWIINDNLIIIEDIEDNINFEGYENELIQCFINIFNNSKDALQKLKDKDKLIFISLYKENDFIFIDFKDNAGGIPKEYINRVFEPYFTTKHKSLGTGIGLNMTYQIITAMDGIISVQNTTFMYNEKEYTGALFKIKFPINKRISQNSLSLPQ
jgi:PAS domain S-box-containing protein